MCFLSIYLKGFHVVKSCFESYGVTEESSGARRHWVVFDDALCRNLSSHKYCLYMAKAT